MPAKRTSKGTSKATSDQSHLVKPCFTRVVFSGRVAQLAEHLLCKQGVRGSNPLTSTNWPSAPRNPRHYINLALELARRRATNKFNLAATTSLFEPRLV